MEPENPLTPGVYLQAAAPADSQDAEVSLEGPRGVTDSAAAIEAAAGYAPDYDARDKDDISVSEFAGFPDFTDADLQAALLSSLKLLAALAAIAVPVVWALAGWQSVILFLVGAALAASGVWDWRGLVGAISERMETNPSSKPRPVTGVMVRMMSRFLMAGAVLYVSLKFLHGSVFALLAGLLLAVVAVSYQAVKLLRRWM